MAKFSAAIDTLAQSGQTIAESLEEAIKSSVKQTVAANESKEIEEQIKVNNNLLHTLTNVILFDIYVIRIVFVYVRLSLSRRQIYSLWCETRQTKLNEELERLRRHERIQEIERITEEMSQKEERLWFFENEDQIDLKIEQNEETIRNLPQPKKQSKAVDENYIPPEVGRRA